MMVMDGDTESVNSVLSMEFDDDIKPKANIKFWFYNLNY